MKLEQHVLSRHELARVRDLEPAEVGPGVVDQKDADVVGFHARRLGPESDPSLATVVTPTVTPADAGYRADVSDVSAVPEPGSRVLAGLGGLLLLGAVRLARNARGIVSNN